MKTLVLYESMFGNTQAVAQAVAQGLASRVAVDVREVGDAPGLDEIDADLLVVGAPTHAFSLSRPGTRADAAAKTGRQVISSDRGIREWLVPSSSPDMVFATFETHVRKPKLPGSAAHAAARRLRRLGATALEQPQTFYVEDLQGPLVAGELEKATAWGTRLAQRLAESAGTAGASVGP